MEISAKANQHFVDTKGIFDFICIGYAVNNDSELMEIHLAASANFTTYPLSKTTSWMQIASCIIIIPI